MLATNHVLSGALIGALARRPMLAFGVGVASHFVLDAVPHWGKWGSHSRFMRVAVPDGLVSLAAMAAFTALAPADRRAAVAAGMTGALLPDINKPATLLRSGLAHAAFFSGFPARRSAGPCTSIQARLIRLNRLNSRVRVNAPRPDTRRPWPARRLRPHACARPAAGPAGVLIGRVQGRQRILRPGRRGNDQRRPEAGAFAHQRGHRLRRLTQAPAWEVTR